MVCIVLTRSLMNYHSVRFQILRLILGAVGTRSFRWRRLSYGKQYALGDVGHLKESSHTFFWEPAELKCCSYCVRSSRFQLDRKNISSFKELMKNCMYVVRMMGGRENDMFTICAWERWHLVRTMFSHNVRGNDRIAIQDTLSSRRPHQTGNLLQHQTIANPD